ncbi:MOSC domain-containing protein [Chlorobium sp.]|uniref:MOSC domain-containing protein n=1 Tax=Chlorobium sp. TaxID=1095 RepID=UPI002F416FBA
MGVIEAVCVSPEKGVVKQAVEEIVLRAEWGIEGDAHAGEWHRQVSLLAGESIDRMREKMPDLDHGAFAENIVTRGIDVLSLAVGDRLQAGDGTVLEVTQIGKQCHNDGCAIQRATGDCIMPREGVFCRVLRGGVLRSGMPVMLL